VTTHVRKSFINQSFAGQDLRDWSFEQCDLSHCDFREAILDETTVLFDCNLAGVYMPREFSAQTVKCYGLDDKLRELLRARSKEGRKEKARQKNLEQRLERLRSEGRLARIQRSISSRLLAVKRGEGLTMNQQWQLERDCHQIGFNYAQYEVEVEAAVDRYYREVEAREEKRQLVDAVRARLGDSKNQRAARQRKLRDLLFDDLSLSFGQVRWWVPRLAFCPPFAFGDAAHKFLGELRAYLVKRLLPEEEWMRPLLLCHHKDFREVAESLPTDKLIELAGAYAPGRKKTQPNSLAVSTSLSRRQ